MAELGESLDPQFMPQTSDNIPQVSKEWDNFLADPKGRAALMNFGLQLMQPMGIGQTAVGQIGQAVGHAGQAVRDINAQEEAARALDIKSKEADSRTMNREQRLAQNEAGLGLRQQALGLSQLRFQNQQDVQKQQLAIRQQLVDLKAERNNARSDYEKSQIDNQIRRLEQQDRSLDIRASDVRSTGEVTPRDQFRAENRSGRDLDALASRQAQSILKQIEQQSFQPESRFPEGLKKYRGKTEEQIAAEFKNDPAWRLRQRGPTVAPAGPNAGVDDESGAPAVDPLEGRTATGPNGQKVVRRNGQWVPQ